MPALPAREVAQSRVPGVPGHCPVKLKRFKFPKVVREHLKAWSKILHGFVGHFILFSAVKEFWCGDVWRISLFEVIFIMRVHG